MFAMKYEVTYEGDLRTSIRHTGSGESITTDAPVDNQGKGRFFSPTDMAAASLASCMMTIAGITAQKRGMEIQSMEAHCEKIMASSPRRIGRLVIDLSIDVGDASDKERTVLERAIRECPVALSLHPDIEQELRLQFV